MADFDPKNLDTYGEEHKAALASIELLDWLMRQKILTNDLAAALDLTPEGRKAYERFQTEGFRLSTSQFLAYMASLHRKYNQGK